MDTSTQKESELLNLLGIFNAKNNQDLAKSIVYKLHELENPHSSKIISKLQKLFESMTDDDEKYDIDPMIENTDYEYDPNYGDLENALTP